MEPSFLWLFKWIPSWINTLTAISAAARGTHIRPHIETDFRVFYTNISFSFDFVHIIFIFIDATPVLLKQDKVINCDEIYLNLFS